MVFTLSFNIAVSRVILQHWQWQSVGYGPVKAVKICSRTSNLTGLSKCLTALPLRLDGWRSEIPLPHFCSALTAKDLMFRFHISALPWLAKIWSSTSALSFCIDCQKCEVPLLHPHFRSAFTAKYVKFCSRASALPLLAKIWSSAFRTCSARTSKDVKFRFRISSLPGLPKICSFASALPLSLDCQRSEDRLLH